MSRGWRTRLASRGTKVVLLKRVLSEFSLFQRSAKVSNREEPIRTGFVETLDPYRGLIPLMGALAVLQASVFSLEEADGPTPDSLVQIVHCSSILHH